MLLCSELLSLVLCAELGGCCGCGGVLGQQVASLASY